MFRRLRLLLAVPLGILLVSASTGDLHLARIARAGDLSAIDHRLRGHISGSAALELSKGPSTQATTSGTYFPSGETGCPNNLGDNVKVNQNCLNVADPNLQGRSQAQNETSIAIDPSNPNHLIGTYNDYRRGDGTCGGSFSLDGGRSWTDTTIPNGFTRGVPFGTARQYWQAGGDTSVAWDTRGNAYFSCQAFMRGGGGLTSNPDLSSAFLVFRSTRNAGASWNFPGRYTTVANDVAATGAILEDKALLTVDNHVESPFRDRVYVTWTEYTATTAYIWEVHSSDYGEHFSDRHLISTASALCSFPISGPKGGCDNNQFSQPFTGADGALYVVWANYNTVDFSPKAPGPARFQVLLTKSTDGGSTFSAPQQVGSYYELPDCATYTKQNPGVSCVPEKGPTSNSYFRAANYPSGAVDPTNPRKVAISYGSYINQQSNERNGCVPTGSDPNSTGGLYTGVKTAGACKNGILLSVSTDGGASFSGTGSDPRTQATVNQAPGQATSDQWFQWAAFTRDGRLAVSYYDRQYGDDETTGFSDFSLSGSQDLARFGVRRVTSSSMPPPTQFRGSFWGDYTGLDAFDRAYPIWADSRAPELFICPKTGTGPGNPPQLCGMSTPNGTANNQDVYMAGVEVPEAG